MSAPPLPPKPGCRWVPGGPVGVPVQGRAGARSQLVSELIEQGEWWLEGQGAVTTFLEGQFALCCIVQGRELLSSAAVWVPELLAARCGAPLGWGWLPWELQFGDA